MPRKSACTGPEPEYVRYSSRGGGGSGIGRDPGGGRSLLHPQERVPTLRGEHLQGDPVEPLQILDRAELVRLLLGRLAEPGCALFEDQLPRVPNGTLFENQLVRSG